MEGGRRLNVSRTRVGGMTWIGAGSAWKGRDGIGERYQGAGEEGGRGGTTIFIVSLRSVDGRPAIFPFFLVRTFFSCRRRDMRLMINKTDEWMRNGATCLLFHVSGMPLWW